LRAEKSVGWPRSFDFSWSSVWRSLGVAAAPWSENRLADHSFVTANDAFVATMLLTLSACQGSSGGWEQKKIGPAASFLESIGVPFRFCMIFNTVTGLKDRALDGAGTKRTSRLARTREKLNTSGVLIFGLRFENV